MAQYNDGETRTINGVTYMRANGVWVAAPSPQQIAPQVQGQILGNQERSATLPYAAPKAAAEAQIAQADASVATTVANAQARQAEANARKAEADLAATGRKEAAGNRAALADLGLLSKQLNRVQELYRSDLAGSGLSSIGEYLPSPKNQRFDSQARNLAALLKPLIRGPGEGTWTDADQKMLDRLVPSSWASDTDNQERFESLKRLIGERATKYGGSFDRVPVEGGSPIGEGIAKQVDAMVNAGLPISAINAALKSQNYAAIDEGEYARAMEWKKQNPERDYFGAKVGQAQSGYANSALGQGLSGANEGLADVLGAPADLAAGAINMGTGAINQLAGTSIPSIDRPFLGSDQISDGMRAIGSIGAPAMSDGGQFARRVGRSIGAAAVPLGGAATTGLRYGAQLLSGLGGGLGGATAQQAFPGNPIAEIAGELVGGGMFAGGATRAMRRAQQRKIEGAVPTVSQLKQQAGDLYRAAESRGVVAKPAQTRQLARNFTGALEAEGRISPTGRISEVYPKAKEAAQLIQDYSGKPMSPTQMQSVRKVISDGMTSPEPAERRLSGILSDTFDDFANPLAPELKDARSVASRYLTAEQLQRARELAGARASQFTGSGFENALRTEYRGLDRASIKGNQRFTGDVTDAIEKVARGTPTSNVLRGLGRLAPTGPVSGMGSIIPGMGIGAVTDPVTGGIAGMGLAGLGIAGRAGATHMGIRAADQAELVARNGGKLPQSPINPEWLEIMRRLGAAEALKYLPSQNPGGEQY